ncbi:MAG TPA: helix-hairpin-helix domain-containing protein, partial [Thermoanaerobaculia bacterium]|nr:helix-hairpin-helix domain-containing protein [Thermoanaerobaculia bacterium]
MRKSLLIVLTLIVAALATNTFAAESSPVVNINTADASQLALLPNVGAKVAQRIVDYRAEHGAFAKTSDLTEVKGIG